MGNVMVSKAAIIFFCVSCVSLIVQLPNVIDFIIAHGRS